MSVRTALILTGALVAGLPALADAAPEKDRGHSVALTASPLHLILPIFEVTGEIYAGEMLSFAAIAGFGQVSVDDGLGGTVDFSVLEVGGQARGYFYGSSEEGAFGGAELVYVSIDGSTEGVSGVGAGLSVGPIVGYKWVWGRFVLDLNGGVSYLSATAEASDGSTTESESSSAWGPNLNFNLGVAL